MPELITVDDALSLPVVERVVKDFPAFSLNKERSKQIKFSTEIELLHNYLQGEALNPLVLLADLNLKQSEYVDEHFLPVYPELNKISSDLRHGTALALAAINNPNRKELLVVVTSQAAFNFMQYKQVFNEALAQSRAKKMPYAEVILAPDGRALLTDNEPEDNIRKILVHAEAVWKANVHTQSPVDHDHAMRLLAHDLIWAQQPPMLGHPQLPERIHPDLQLANELRAGKYLESWKAFYCFKPPEPRLCSIYFFQKFLLLFGITVATEQQQRNESFLVPLQPGVLLAMCLAAFLQEMDVAKVFMELADNKAQIQIALRNPSRFRDAVRTNTGGRGKDRFYELLACSCSVAHEYAQSDNDKMILKSFPPHPLREDDETKAGKVLKQVVFWESTDKGVQIWWPSPRVRGDL
jgi:hypothetical protein